MIDFGISVSRILSHLSCSTSHVGGGNHSSSDTVTSALKQSTRKFRAGRTQTFPYLILLRAEFGCFHSNNSLKSSRSHFSDHRLGHSLCSTVPHLTVEGRYPLRYPMESGLSSKTIKSSRFPKIPRLNLKMLGHFVKDRVKIDRRGTKPLGLVGKL